MPTPLALVSDISNLVDELILQLNKRMITGRIEGTLFDVGGLNADTLKQTTAPVDLGSWWVDTSVSEQHVLRKYNAGNTTWEASTIREALFDSPALTGVPTAPTPLISDDSTKIATTAWVNLQDFGGAANAWTPDNDGPGSGLDADLLDGLNSTAFLRNDNSTNNVIASGQFLRFTHPEEFNTSDGRIGAGLFTPGLNIVGTQTEDAVNNRRRIGTYGFMTIGANSIGSATVPALGQDGIEGAGTLAIVNTARTYGLLFGVKNTGVPWIQAQRIDGTATGYDMELQPNGGSVWFEENRIRIGEWADVAGYLGLVNSDGSAVIVSSATAPHTVVGAKSGGSIFLRPNGTSAQQLDLNATEATFFSGTVRIGNPAGTNARYDSSGRVSINGGAYQTICHAGNDGPGSGFDADLLDGVQGSNYMRKDIVDIFANGYGARETFNINSDIYSGAIRYNPSTTGAPTTDWHNAFRSRSTSWGFPNHYCFDIAHPFFDDRLWARRVTNGSFGAWREILTHSHLPVDVWYKSHEGNDRLYYESGGITYHKSASDHRFRNTANAENVIITSAGNLTALGNITAFSDIRAKENFEPVVNALDIIEKINPVWFDWKTEFANGRGRETGFIAQEVEQVLPHLVITDSVVHEEGLEPSNGLTDMKSVDYGKMSVIAIAAIKEQQVLINKQQVLIDGLIQRIENLEDK